MRSSRTSRHSRTNTPKRCPFHYRGLEYKSQETHGSVQSSRSVMSESLWPHGLQHTRPPCPSPTPGAHSNSCPSSHWCHPAISSSVVPFSSCLQSFPELGSFPMSWLFGSGSQITGASVSASVLPMNIQDWFPLALTGLISLQSKGLSRVISNTTILRHSIFFMVPLSYPYMTTIWKNHGLE